MNILNKCSVYLAGPMENDQNGDSWRDMVKRELKHINLKVLNPYDKPFLSPWYKEAHADQILMKKWRDEGNFEALEEKMRAVRASDLALCDICTFAIVYLNPKIFTVGTIEEITVLNRAKRPIFVMFDSDKPSLWLYGMFSHKYIYRTWDSLLDTLKKIDSGEIEADSRRWRLLTEEYR